MRHRARASLSISAEYARLIQPFISTEETRYYLTGFYVEPHHHKGCLIVATNGHAMGIFHDVDGACSAPGIIRLNKPTLLACLHEKRPRAGTPALKELSLVVRGSNAFVYRFANSGKGTRRLIAMQDDAVIDGTFPDWRALIPAAGGQSEPASFNAELLRRFSHLREGDKARSVITVMATGPETPAIVITGRKDFFGVVMPIRGPDMVYPVWIPTRQMAKTPVAPVLSVGAV
jgi:hypothetical protein